MTLTPMSCRCRRCGVSVDAAGAAAQGRTAYREPSAPPLFCSHCSLDLGSEAAQEEYLRLALLA